MISGINSLPRNTSVSYTGNTSARTLAPVFESEISEVTLEYAKEAVGIINLMSQAIIDGEPCKKFEKTSALEILNIIQSSLSNYEGDDPIPDDSSGISIEEDFRSVYYLLTCHNVDAPHDIAGLALCSKTNETQCDLIGIVRSPSQPGAGLQMIRDIVNNFPEDEKGCSITLSLGEKSGTLYEYYIKLGFREPYMPGDNTMVLEFRSPEDIEVWNNKNSPPCT